jgi:hypothetical protein
VPISVQVLNPNFELTIALNVSFILFLVAPESVALKCHTLASQKTNPVDKNNWFVRCFQLVHSVIFENPKIRINYSAAANDDDIAI